MTSCKLPPKVLWSDGIWHNLTLAEPMGKYYHTNPTRAPRFGLIMKIWFGDDKKSFKTLYFQGTFWRPLKVVFKEILSFGQFGVVYRNPSKFSNHDKSYSVKFFTPHGRNNWMVLEALKIWWLASNNPNKHLHLIDYHFIYLCECKELKQGVTKKNFIFSIFSSLIYSFLSITPCSAACFTLFFLLVFSAFTKPLG